MDILSPECIRFQQLLRLLFDLKALTGTQLFPTSMDLAGALLGEAKRRNSLQPILGNYPLTTDVVTLASLIELDLGVLKTEGYTSRRVCGGWALTVSGAHLAVGLRLFKGIETVISELITGSFPTILCLFLSGSEKTKLGLASSDAGGD